MVLFVMEIGPMELPAVIDATDASFEADALDASHQCPIVVDFWAPWCGPCQTLGPLLERLARESQGGFRLVKVDIDQNPMTARAFGVQSIPFVAALREGEVVNEFVGAQPESVVRQFLERVLPDEADDLATRGEQARLAGQSEEAESLFREALGLRPGQAMAAFGLAQIQADAGKTEEALQTLDAVVPEGAIGAEAQRLAARLRLANGENETTDASSLRATVASDPANLEATLALGHIESAAGRHQEALALFLEVVRRDRNFEEGAARKAMLDIFTVLGRENPLVEDYQRRLSGILFA